MTLSLRWEIKAWFSARATPLARAALATKQNRNTFDITDGVVKQMLCKKKRRARDYDDKSGLVW